MKLPFEAELNERQVEAVLHVQGPLLVFAGAGSGKTRVITFRVANLVAAERVPPYRILAVTFTNKAAGEMRARLEALLGPDLARSAWAGTFHATCARLLRVHGAAIGLARNFVIYDGADQKSVVTRVLRELGLDEKRYPPRAMLAAIHKEKQEGRGPEQLAIGSYFDEVVARVYDRYESYLRGANAVDFEDLILRTLRLLQQPDVRDAEAIRRRFDFVLVDEFQDTNATQYQLLRELVRGHGNLCVVGDDDQSIYRWRGADVRNIRGFQHDFPNAKVVKLEQNYRSTARIVKAALGVISPSPDREPKHLWTANEEGPRLDVVAARDERDEAAHVVRVIGEALARGVAPHSVAVFYRIHAQSRVIEEALRAANVPYQIIGGTKFYERAEVKDALSYLRILVNPKSDVDFVRIVNTPPRGIGAATVERLTSFATARALSLTEALEQLDALKELGAGPRKKLAAVRLLLGRLCEQAAQRTPSDLLRHLLEETGYREALRLENDAESDARLENLEELYGSIVDYEVDAEASGEPATLEGYLERVSLQSDIDALRDAPRITLMTVHGAKGLEFDLVLLTGLEEGMFPYRGLEPTEGDHREQLEEERRLAYVAITRARRKLVMTYASMRQIFGTTRPGVPSRFLSDLPSELVEHSATAHALPRTERFVDRFSDPSLRAYGGAGRASAAALPGKHGWVHPQAPTPPRVPLSPGERAVDTQFFADGADTALCRGARVVHARFGEGKVLRVDMTAEPTVVAFFPGWGEKKVLAKYLKLS